jgi:hypothetical protein
LIASVNRFGKRLRRESINDMLLFVADGDIIHFSATANVDKLHVSYADFATYTTLTLSLFDSVIVTRDRTDRVARIRLQTTIRHVAYSAIVSTGACTHEHTVCTHS